MDKLEKHNLALTSAKLLVEQNLQLYTPSDYPLLVKDLTRHYNEALAIINSEDSNN